MTRADFFLILIAAFSAAGQFMTYDTRHRDQPYAELLSKSLHYMTCTFLVCVIEDINQELFHFSGYSGKLVALIVVYAGFVDVPRRGMDILCRRYIFKGDAPKTA